MIRPTKYMDPSVCVLSVAAHVLKTLMHEGAVTVDRIAETVESNLGPAGRHNIPGALALLYLLGRVQYAEEADMIVQCLVDGAANEVA